MIKNTDQLPQLKSVEVCASPIHMYQRQTLTKIDPKSVVLWYKYQSMYVAQLVINEAVGGEISLEVLNKRLSPGTEPVRQ